MADENENTAFDADESAGADFQPLYHAPKVEVKTLEEDEIVVFKMRAKLFVFVKEDIYGGEVRKNFWKERGTGDMKLLRHKEFGKIRLLMRQEKTLKICANHLVSPHVSLAANVGSDRSWVFSAADFADEELKTETFAIKFANSENANKFKECVELAKKINAGEADPESAKPIEEDEEPGATTEKKESEESTSQKVDDAENSGGKEEKGLEVSGTKDDVATNSLAESISKVKVEEDSASS